MARASLEELTLDYEDLLRQPGLVLWPLEDPRRDRLIATRPKALDEFLKWTRETHGQPPTPRTTYPEIAANGALALLRVACYLLDRQLAAQAKTFLNNGGFTERLYRTRRARRDSTPLVD